MEYVKQESTLPIAVRLFTLAADAKHLLAYWYLAQLNHAGIGVKPSCQVAVSVWQNTEFCYLCLNASIMNSFISPLLSGAIGFILLLRMLTRPINMVM